MVLFFNFFKYCYILWIFICHQFLQYFILKQQSALDSNRMQSGNIHYILLGVHAVKQSALKLSCTTATVPSILRLICCGIAYKLVPIFRNNGVTGFNITSRSSSQQLRCYLKSVKLFLVLGH